MSSTISLDHIMFNPEPNSLMLMSHLQCDTQSIDSSLTQNLQSYIEQFNTEINVDNDAFINRGAKISLITYHFNDFLIAR